MSSCAAWGKTGSISSDWVKKVCLCGCSMARLLGILLSCWLVLSMFFWSKFQMIKDLSFQSSSAGLTPLRSAFGRTGSIWTSRHPRKCPTSWASIRSSARRPQKSATTPRSRWPTPRSGRSAPPSSKRSSTWPGRSSQGQVRALLLLSQTVHRNFEGSIFLKYEARFCSK